MKRRSHWRLLNVCRQDQPWGFITVGDDPKQLRRAVPVCRDIVPLVEDEQVSMLDVLLQPFEGPARCAQAEHQVGDHEEADRISLRAPLDTQRGGQIRLPGATDTKSTRFQAVARTLRSPSRSTSVRTFGRSRVAS
jgi:hypothetical protein